MEAATDTRRGDGVLNKVIHTMDLLKDQGVPFGYSVTVTKQNIDEVFSDTFIDAMIDKGGLYG